MSIRRVTVSFLKLAEPQKISSKMVILDQYLKKLTNFKSEPKTRCTEHCAQMVFLNY